MMTVDVARSSTTKPDTISATAVEDKAGVASPIGRLVCHHQLIITCMLPATVTRNLHLIIHISYKL